MRVAAPAQERPVLAPGLVIEEILADSAAAKAEFTVGDRVLSYDARPLLSPAALQAAEENTLNKGSVVLRVQRGDETLTLNTPLGKLGIQTRPALPSSALTLYQDGKAALKTQKTDDVIARWTNAARAARDAGETVAAAWLHGRVGEIHEGQRQWKEASEAHAAAWELLKQSGDRADQSRRLFALGRCIQNLNDFVGARQWYVQAHQVDLAEGNELWAAGDLNNLGAIALNRGDLPEAEDFHGRALTIRERLVPDSLEVAASLNNLGSVIYRRGDLPRALEYFSRVLGIRERLAPDSLEVAASLNNLGAVAYSRGNLDAAYEYHSRAYVIREKRAPNSLALGVSLMNLGIISWSRGDLEAAQDQYGRALAMQERLAPNSLDVAFSVNALGLVARDRGDLAAALDHFSRALGLRERIAPDSLDVAISLNNVALIARARGDLVAAEDYHRRSLAIKERLAPESLDVAVSLNNLGDIAHSRGDLPRAQDYHSRALTIRERLAPNSLDVASSLSNLGLVAQARGDLPAAQDYHARTLGMRERLSPNSLRVAQTLTDLGVLAGARNDLATSQDFHRRALSLRERLAPDSLEVASDLNGLGHVALEQRRFTDALPLFTRAVDIVETQRWHVRSAEARALLLAQHTESYTGLLRTHLALGDVPSAFATGERARARSLLDILSEARAEIRQGVDPTLLERERRLQQQLNARANRQTQTLNGPHTDNDAEAARKELDALLIQYREVQAQIRITSPRYAALTQPQPLGLREIQQQVLDPDTLLLEYALGEEASYVFAVTACSIRSFELPKRSVIEMASRHMYELLTARQPVQGETAGQRQARIQKADAEYPAAAAALSQMVLGPVMGQLADKRLLIVADGALQYVPFAALPEPGVAASAQPLIVKHEIVNLPSASVVAVLRREYGERPLAERLVAVLADPVFDAADLRLQRARNGQAIPPPTASLPADVERAVRGTGFVTDRGTLSRLPFTRDEADAILALAPAGQSPKAIDFNASRATITSADLSRYRIVHLATHGVLNTEHPELSGIVLSLVDEQGVPQDGFLRLHEVYNLSWSAELVVLSACQTALGKEINGEGLVGLTRGFMYGGAERVLASVWNVNDSVTAQFMKRFYQGLLAQGLTPAAALRAAQVEMWRRTPTRAPYYWAAFVLQGEWR